MGLDWSLVHELMNKTQEEVRNMKSINIMVVGKTGVGKSTLINSIFRENMATTGIGKPVTQHLRRISKEDVPFVLYDTRGFELEKSVQAAVKKEILKVIETCTHEDKEEKIHVVYYCINANGSRIEELEIDLIHQIGKKVPVIVVLTQSIGTQSEEFRRYIEQLNLPVRGVINVMAKPFPIYEQVTIPVSGLVELVELTFQTVPKEVGEALTNVQQVDVAQKAKLARKWATRYIATTFGVGFSPIPFSDATLLVPMQVTMMAHITAIFGVNMDKSTLVALVSVIGGTGGATYLGRYIVSNLLKLIPGIGSIAGGIISGATASVLTMALAISYIEVLVIMVKNEQQELTMPASKLASILKEKVEMRLRQGLRNSDIRKMKKEQLELPIEQQASTKETNVQQHSSKQANSPVKNKRLTIGKKQPEQDKTKRLFGQVKQYVENGLERTTNFLKKKKQK